MGVVKKWLGLDRKSQKKRLDAMKGDPIKTPRLNPGLTNDQGREAAMSARWDEMRSGKRRKVDFTGGGSGRTLIG